MSDPDIRMGFVLERALLDFRMINTRDGLTEADKQQLKNAYLQNYFEPEARELLKAKLAPKPRMEARIARRHARLRRQNKTAS